MKVVVTGAASRFAHVLLPLLCVDDAVTEVRSVDAHPTQFTHAKLRSQRAGIAERALHDMLSGADALIHLHYAQPSPHLNGEALFELNVRAAHKLFHAARAGGVQRLIHLSTAAVYGSAVHANEDAPLKPIPGFTYAEHQAHLEQLLAIDFPDCIRLRPHVMVGPHAHPLVKLWLRLPFHARLGDTEPLFQCVHEGDVARVAVSCLKLDARGAYNLAIDKSFTLRDALRERHRLTIPLPASIARRGIDMGARFTHSDADMGWVPALSRTLLVNCRRAIIELDWKPRHGLREALRDI